MRKLRTPKLTRAMQEQITQAYRNGVESQAVKMMALQMDIEGICLYSRKFC